MARKRTTRKKKAKTSGGKKKAVREPVKADAHVAALVKASEKIASKAKVGDAAAVLSTTVLDDIAGTGPKGKRSYAYLRHVAGVYYVTSVDAPSVPDLAKHPLFASMSISQLHVWCAEDHWTDRRANFLERHRHQIEDQMGNALLAARAQQIKKVTGVTDIALEILEKNKGDFNSWEGVAGAYARLNSLVEDLRAKVAADLPKGEVTPGAAADITVESTLTDAEAHAAAALILQRRREAQQQQPTEGAAETADAQPPALRVVKGDG